MHSRVKIFWRARVDTDPMSSNLSASFTTMLAGTPTKELYRGNPLNAIRRFLLVPTEAPRSILLVRIAVGLIFFTQGLLKYIDPNIGVARFTRIGFPHPYFAVLCGLLLLLGLWTRLVSIPLLIVITTAIATTKAPELFRANQGFWYMVSDARTDFAMFCCLVFLFSVGGGSWSLDARLAKHNRNGG